MQDTITIALPKGRLLTPCINLLKKAGISHNDLQTNSRKLLFEDKKSGIRMAIIRAVDVATYVEYGAADMGIVGRDVLLEQEREVYEPLDLEFGACRISVASPRKPLKSRAAPSKIRIATKYPRITERFFNEKGLSVEIIKLSGAIELAPFVGLADRIVDLITTGKSLRENGLVEEELIAKSSAQLIINRASFKTKTSSVNSLVERIRKAVKEKGS